MFATFVWLGIHEADIAITDFILFLECLIFSILVYYKKQNKKCKKLFITFFIATAFSALFGGITHGFFYLKPSLENNIFWRLTVFSIVVVGWTMWILATHILNPRHYFPMIIGLGNIQLAVYTAIILYHVPSFLVAVCSYLPSALFLFIVMLLKWLETKKICWKYGVIGLAITIIATILHEVGIYIHPYYFTRSALYHVWMMVALIYMYMLSTQKYFLSEVD